MWPALHPAMWIYMLYLCLAPKWPTWVRWCCGGELLCAKPSQQKCKHSCCSQCYDCLCSYVLCGYCLEHPCWCLKKKDFGWLSSLHLASTEHIVTNLVFFRHLSLLLWDSNLGTHRSPRSLGILHQNQLWWLLRHRQERASSSCNSNTLKCKIAKKKTQYLKPKNCCLSIFK